MSTRAGLLKRAGKCSKGSGETGDFFCSVISVKSSTKHKNVRPSRAGNFGVRTAVNAKLLSADTPIFAEPKSESSLRICFGVAELFVAYFDTFPFRVGVQVGKVCVFFK